MLPITHSHWFVTARHMQLFQLNFNDKKINEMNEADNGLKFSWTFNAGKGEVKSEGNEQCTSKTLYANRESIQSTWVAINNRMQQEL